MEMFTYTKAAGVPQAIQAAGSHRPDSSPAEPPCST